jgi:hypothetical protein
VPSSAPAVDGGIQDQIDLNQGAPIGKRAETRTKVDGVIDMFIWPIVLIVILIAVVWYARDEINRDEYLEKRRDLGATQ